MAASSRRACVSREATAAARANGGRPTNETCVICIGTVNTPVELPCGHAYCRGCVAELRAKGVAQSCPLCRAELPPGVDGLYDLAWRAQKRVGAMVQRGEASWASLQSAEREEIGEAIAMLTEAGAQGHAQASLRLGVLLVEVRKDVDGAEAAFRTAIAADPGHASAHYSLGHLLQAERRDVDEAEAAFRAAIAADPGHIGAHTNLGILLRIERHDIDGAEAAYRAAIAARPGDAKAHCELRHSMPSSRRPRAPAPTAVTRAGSPLLRHARTAIRPAPPHSPPLPLLPPPPPLPDLRLCCLVHAPVNLGILLHTERRDADGAEAALRAAIAMAPGHAKAHYNLGVVLWERARRIENDRDGDLAAAVALLDECAQLWSLCHHGADNERTKASRDKAAALLRGERAPRTRRESERTRERSPERAAPRPSVPQHNRNGCACM